METEKVALVAVLGTSPAVLTETIWALHTEKPELVPDVVKIFTTQVGWDKFEKNVYTPANGPSVWEDLQNKVGKEITVSKCIFQDRRGGDLKDIITCKDQELVADQLLKGIRECKNPMQEPYRLVGSVAGGRKSMSALMYAAMSLGADADDIITHVLADDKVLGFEDFYFPGQTKQQLEPRGGDKSLTMTAADVKIDLAEIPFVPLATLVKNSDFSTAGTFSKLVQQARQTVAKIRPQNTTIRLSKKECKVTINGQPLKLKVDEYALMAIIVEYANAHRGEKDRRLPDHEATEKTLKDIQESLPKAVREEIRKGKKKKDGKAVDERANAFLKAENWENGISTTFNSVRFRLRETLIKNGFEEVAEDAFPKSQKAGFNEITDIKFSNK